MADDVGGCDALVCALLSMEPDIPNAHDLILRAAVATSYIAEEDSLRSGGETGNRKRYSYGQFWRELIFNIDGVGVNLRALMCYPKGSPVYVKGLGLGLEIIAG